MQEGKWISQSMRPASSLAEPTFAMPPLACDCHMHVFGSDEVYEPDADAKYTKPEGDLDQYRAVAERLGIGRMVFVQASYYGTDNRCILDAAARCGERARAVVFLPEGADARMLDDFQRRGVRGIRLDLFKASKYAWPRERVVAAIERAAAIAAPLGWHLEFYAPGRWVVDLLGVLDGLAVDWSVNHMGFMTEAEGLTDADFGRFVDLLRGRGWVKLTGPYRVSPDGPDSRPDAMASALIQAAPDRCLWGTDWPHIPDGGRDTGALLERFARWCPDPALRERILVANPARLYGFD